MSTLTNVEQSTTITVVAPSVYSVTRLPHDDLISVRLSSAGGFQNGMVSLVTDDDGLDRMIDYLVDARVQLNRSALSVVSEAPSYTFTVPETYHCDNHTPGDVFTVRIVGDAGQDGWITVENVETGDQFPVQPSELVSA